MLLTILLFSCSSNDDETNIVIKDDAFRACDDLSVYDPNYEFTNCCVHRVSELGIDKLVEYEYSINLEDPEYYWDVVSGEIEIVSGKKSKIVTIAFKDGFEGAILRGKSSAIYDATCSALVSIVKD